MASFGQPASQSAGGGNEASGSAGSGAASGAGGFGGFGTGVQLGQGAASFFDQIQAAKRDQRTRSRNFEITQGQLRSLLGIASGNVLKNNPGNDFVGGIEDPRSRFLAQGTLVDGPNGGLDPGVFAARENLFHLLNTQAITPENEAQLQQFGNEQIGQQLNNSNAPGRNLNESLSRVTNFGGAGQSAANVALQSAMANRAFSNQVAGQGASFLNSLFSSAGATV